MNRKNFFKGYICVALSAIIFGLIPLMAKFLYADGLDPKSLVLIRNIISVPCFLALTLFTEKSIKIKEAALPSVAFAAVTGCCITPFLLFTSYNYLPSGTATVLHFIYPAAVVAGEFLFLKNKPGAWRIISVILCVSGICMFYEPGSALSLKGGALAVLSGMTYAAYVICVSGFKYKKEISDIKFSFYVALFSTFIMSVACAFSGDINLPRTLTGWLLVTVFAVSVNVGAVALFHKGAFLIGGGRSAVIGSFEPVVSILAGIVVFNEKATFWTVAGSVSVIAASVLIALCDIKKLQSK